MSSAATAELMDFNTWLLKSVNVASSLYVVWRYDSYSLTNPVTNMVGLYHASMGWNLSIEGYKFQLYFCTYALQPNNWNLNTVHDPTPIHVIVIRNPLIVITPVDSSFLLKFP